MILSRELKAVDGVMDSAVVMEPRRTGLFLRRRVSCWIVSTTPTAPTACGDQGKNGRNQEWNPLLNRHPLKILANKNNEGENFNPRSFESALEAIPDANLALISVAGKYAAAEAMKALKAGLHVMLFSDNVTSHRKSS